MYGSYSYLRKMSSGFICYEFIVLLQKWCVLPPSNTKLVLSVAFWQHKSLSVWAESYLIRLHQTHEVEGSLVMKQNLNKMKEHLLFCNQLKYTCA